MRAFGSGLEHGESLPVHPRGGCPLAPGSWGSRGLHQRIWQLDTGCCEEIVQTAKGEEEAGDRRFPLFDHVGGGHVVLVEVVEGAWVGPHGAVLPRLGVVKSGREELAK